MIIRHGDTPKQSIDRAAARKRRRIDNAKFIAETQGVAVLLNFKGAMAKLDHLVSLYVRRRDRMVHAGACLVCMAKQRLGLLDRAPEPITLAYHIVPRGDQTTRWHLWNVIGACKRCNDGERWSRTRASLRARYRLIHIEVLDLIHGIGKGEAILIELERLSTLTADFSVADILAKCDETKQLMGDTNGQHRL